MTLLCLDVRNGRTVLGLFDGETLAGRWEVASDERRTGDEWNLLIGALTDGAGAGRVDAVSLACTVPTILREMRVLFERHHPEAMVSVVEPGTRTGVPILTDNPREVGADRIANARAAVTVFGGPCVVVDFETATTFDVIDAAGRYVGGAIAPGVSISLEALAARGAQLRSVELVRPRSVIAKNTVEALQAGVVFGVAGQVDGIVTRIAAALEVDVDTLDVVATGAYADLIREECATITHHAPLLTLTGLRLIHERVVAS